MSASSHAINKSSTQDSPFPGGLVVRIRRSHRRGPGSIPGQGTLFCRFEKAGPPKMVGRVKNNLRRTSDLKIANAPPTVLRATSRAIEGRGGGSGGTNLGLSGSVARLLAKNGLLTQDDMRVVQRGNKEEPPSHTGSRTRAAWVKTRNPDR
ncbi:hypothetical protein ROHU_003254 [Labeo rohita]|uniref:Uncharacterized protein n=1 Tax=Labeo rohita TaxID=84645 RepID=A0A498NW33_LABRO|nr:hypothetical protein ROHU_003254 [Labeo rohita]